MLEVVWEQTRASLLLLGGLIHVCVCVCRYKSSKAEQHACLINTPCAILLCLLLPIIRLLFMTTVILSCICSRFSIHSASSLYSTILPSSLLTAGLFQTSILTTNAALIIISGQSAQEYRWCCLFLSEHWRRGRVEPSICPAVSGDGRKTIIFLRCPVCAVTSPSLFFVFPLHLYSASGLFTLVRINTVNPKSEMAYPNKIPGDNLRLFKHSVQ